MLLKNPTRNDDLSIAVWREEPEGLLAPCNSEAMKSIQSVIADLADTNIPVMITGETGTGKEVVGLAIHRRSKRRNGSFIKIRCSRLTPGDFSELLPSAAQNLPENANLNTVLLDEVADMDPACQTRLLETFSAFNGGPEAFQPAACVISTTGQNLEHLMEAGQFRHDLYYRLTGVCLKLPPLRQRREDIMPLANFFLDKYSALFGRPRRRLSGTMSRILSDYSWPGNIRELENAMKRVAALEDEHLAWKDLIEAPKESFASPGSEACSLKQAARAASRQAERELILKVLTQTKWNRKRAAEELRISYKALLYKLKQIGQEEKTP
jgi:DNA-binding NtrC family response regulator